MQQGIYNPPITHYRHFPIENKYVRHIGRIIGKNGCNFIHQTRKNGVDYIWYNDKLGVIEIWGPEQRLMKAEESLKHHNNVILSRSI